jgi:hypothetical protein
MRLINTHSLELEEFYGDKIPQYAILSHTWTDEEVTYQDWLDCGRRTRKEKGHHKVKRASAIARESGFQYLWCDTNCIIQTHHRRQRPTKRVAYAAENGGRMYIAFQYKRINISLPSTFSI